LKGSKVAKIRARVIVEGQVQGVYFRSYILEKAKKLNLTGFVRNLVDGRVEIIIEGKRGDVKTLVDWCHKGPPSARVSEVKVDWEEYSGRHHSFSVRY